MFAGIWKILPGPRWLKAIEVLIILFAVITFLFEIGFPWIMDNTSWFDPAID